MVDCLKDSDQSVREAATKGLLSIAAHCMFYHLFPLTCRTMIVAEFHEGVQLAICGIVGQLKDSDKTICTAAINGLSSLVAHGMRYLLFPFNMLNHEYR